MTAASALFSICFVRSLASSAHASAISSSCFLCIGSFIVSAIFRHSSACCSYSDTFCKMASLTRQHGMPTVNGDPENPGHCPKSPWCKV
jgi:hypothetical protein